MNRPCWAQRDNDDQDAKRTAGQVGTSCIREKLMIRKDRLSDETAVRILGDDSARRVKQPSPENAEHYDRDRTWPDPMAWLEGRAE
jgi:hypothetical protein